MLLFVLISRYSESISANGFNSSDNVPVFQRKKYFWLPYNNRAIMRNPAMPVCYPQVLFDYSTLTLLKPSGGENRQVAKNIRQNARKKCLERGGILIAPPKGVTKKPNPQSFAKR